ncbi:MAG: hypothetical protein DRP51_02960 [Candidatus Zixiibacteriota bacterium]|nr:MAG: hypothetical protein DRP51_02960 [candidate division Zixibacteria bacterium]
MLSFLNCPVVRSKSYYQIYRYSLHLSGNRFKNLTLNSNRIKNLSIFLIFSLIICRGKNINLIFHVKVGSPPADILNDKFRQLNCV